MSRGRFVVGVDLGTTNTVVAFAPVDGREAAGRVGEGREAAGRVGEGREAAGRVVEGREAAGRVVEGREAAGRVGDGREAAGRVGDGREAGGRAVEGREAAGRVGDGGPAPRVLDVPQLVTAGEAEALPLLPSTLYAPLEGEIPNDPFGEPPWTVGAFARGRGVDVPGRAVTSSKSWLSYGRVDRTAAILPWGLDEDDVTTPRISPVDAAARVLAHVAVAWREGHPSDPLTEQEIVLTIPASFDDVARELTLEAARRAWLSVRLLEEPQAAFYAFLNSAGGSETEGGAEKLEQIVDAAGGEALVLVVDVGGGTTDLSLFRVTRAQGPRPFEVARVAVGHHLLLGGDNMDLALAHLAEQKIGQKLDAARFAQLAQACRGAKEALLGEDSIDAFPVRIAGRGAALIGSMLKAELTREDAERVVLDGFWPLAPRDAKPVRGGGALVAFGLPYERDPAVTRHVAHFFARHAGAVVAPHALLLNGGVFLAKRIADRLVETFAAWGAGAPTVLSSEGADVAVALGAVRYGLARLGQGVRIEAGAPRGYYVGLASAPGAEKQLVCVVPRGAKEGVVHAAKGRTFALKVGRPVRFDLFASDEALDASGDVVIRDDRFEPLPPALVSFDGKGAEVDVELEGELTPLGTLDVACVARDGSARRHRLAFDLRGATSPKSSMPPSMSMMPPSIGTRTLAAERRAVETDRLAAAREAVELIFGKGRADVAPRQVKDLVRDLEKLLGERAGWTTAIARGLVDVLVSNAKSRKRGLDHERVFWLLTGFCLRPGFGDPNDAARMAEVAPLFDEKLQFPTEARGFQQFWIAWRRVSGGLDEAAQTKIRDALDPFLAPAEKRLKKPKGWRFDVGQDVLDLVSALERVPAARRSELGGWLLERTWTDRDPRLWAAIGRLGAREPAYASAHHVISPLVAERWLDHLMREKWEARELQIAARDLARVTDDRARDVSEKVRREVDAKLGAFGAPEAFRRVVRERVDVDEADHAAFFGDSLPVGLRLVS